MFEFSQNVAYLPATNRQYWPQNQQQQQQYNNAYSNSYNYNLNNQYYYNQCYNGYSQNGGYVKTPQVVQNSRLQEKQENYCIKSYNSPQQVVKTNENIFKEPARNDYTGQYPVSKQIKRSNEECLRQEGNLFS
jgi:hypothetical protein